MWSGFKWLLLVLLLCIVGVVEVGSEPRPCPCQHPTVKDASYDPALSSTHRSSGLGYDLTHDTLRICVPQTYERALSTMTEEWKEFYQAEVVFVSKAFEQLPSNLSHPLCHVYLNFTDQTDSTTRRLCPEECRPLPVLTIAKPMLQGSGPSFAITCSLTLQHLLQRYQHAKKTAIVPSWMSFLLYESAMRRYYECFEIAALQRHAAWLNISQQTSSSGFVNLRSKTKSTIPYHKVPSTQGINRREVQGLVIWIGSTDRMSMVFEQTHSLKGATFHDRKAIIPWLATDEIYPCHPSTIKCYGNLKKYGGLFPQSAINFMKPGWGCAQRRPLRALAHILLFFEPEYVILLDDDTFFNWPLFQQHMLPFVRSNMSVDPIYLGEAMGRTGTNGHLSTVGMFVGGSGYIIGQKILQRLVSREVVSLGYEYVKFGRIKDFLLGDNINEKTTPLFADDAFRSALHKEKLGILQEGLEYSLASCPKYNISNQLVDSCIFYQQGRRYHNETWGVDGLDTSTDTVSTSKRGSKSRKHSPPYLIPTHSNQYQFSTVPIGVRLIDFCTNMLANDNTCLHSDHSIGRCFIYGAGASPLITACENKSPNVTQAMMKSGISFHDNHLFFGMCFMAPQCKLDQHVTCHRYQATVNLEAVRTSESSGHYKRFSSIYDGSNELDSGV